MDIKIVLPDELIEQLGPFLKEGNFNSALSELVQVSLNEYLGLRAPLPPEFAENSPEVARKNAGTPGASPTDSL